MERIWLKHYPAGVTFDINPDVYTSIVDLFETAVSRFGKKTALYHMGSTMTYKALEKKSRYFASFLQNVLNLKPGDRLAIMLPNTMQYIVSVIGALRAGMTVVNVNPLYTARELEHQVNDAQVDTIVVMSNFVETVKTTLPKTRLKHVIVTEIADLFPQWKSGLINFIARRIKKVAPTFHMPDAILFKKALKQGARASFQPVEVCGEDIAFLQYTGGTTGVSKGAKLSHRNMIANVEQAYAWMSQSQIKEGQEILITALPLYHIFSLMMNGFAFLKVGVKNVLITNPKDIPGLIRELSKHRFTIFSGVNTLFKALLRHRNFKKLDFSSLKIAIGGGMAVHKQVAADWAALTGVPLLEAYGLTEASPGVCCNPLGAEKFSGSIGYPFPSTDIKIVDHQGIELPVEAVGELCVHGPQVMQGYWNRPQETMDVLTEDGWLRTGDIAKIDAEGQVFIVDRKKDMIVVSGYNVYPNEVETAIAEHPDVLEVAVIGEPNENTGEVIKAFVVRKDESLTREKLMAFCRERLTFYKIPKHYEFCGELPKTNVGKILRRALREERFRNKNVQ
ncbi:MAG: AMP-binding protein [Pseudomonadota bacterium]|nr:AMP-binding protein [Gammaproteobacteria bacterium]MBU1927036.1 AMP-binding protein [Gammaproteobacteria bacterium]